MGVLILPQPSSIDPRVMRHLVRLSRSFRRLSLQKPNCFRDSVDVTEASKITVDVEEIDRLVEQRLLFALRDFDVFAYDGHPILAVARRWLVLELGNLFTSQLFVFVAVRDDNLLFVVWLAATFVVGLRLLLVATSERFPRTFVERFGDFHQVWLRVVAEHELDSVVVPAIEVFRQREVGVASQQDLAKAGGTTMIDRQIKIRSLQR